MPTDLRLAGHVEAERDRILVGSGPEEALGRVLDAPVLFLGIGLPGDRIHGRTSAR